MLLAALFLAALKLSAATNAVVAAKFSN